MNYLRLDQESGTGPRAGVPGQGAERNAYPPHSALFYLLPWPLSHNLWTLFNMACLLVLGYLLFEQFAVRMRPLVQKAEASYVPLREQGFA